MPDFHLLKGDSNKRIIEWINRNLSKQPFTPHKEELNSKLTSKGIYFWFIKPKGGYDALSKFVDIDSSNTKFKKEFKKIECELVYIGMTGTEENSSNLYTRLNNQHINGNIKGSTLRKGLATLISENLQPPIEDEVNELLKNFFLVQWIEYPKSENKSIKADEDFLIKELKPLLNIKHNKNSYKSSKPNPTKTYSERRKKILKLNGLK